jgi:D-serine deaminase-like pyridoxal phosphate-dependent protein
MKITAPTLLLDKSKCLANIQQMSEKAARSGVSFRPHFKTHQSAITGSWFRDFGVTAITVSSVDMAIYFAAAGWKDITIAFPYNPRETERLKSLTSMAAINLLLVDPSTVRLLGKSLDSEVGFFIEVDAGYHRSGMTLDHYHEMLDLLDIASRFPNLVFKGFLSHFGNTYKAESPAAVRNIYNCSMEQLVKLKDALSGTYGDLTLSVGDTPSCSILEDFGGADEIRPGNFVFYDVMQSRIGSCTPGQIAVCLAAPVVAKNKERFELVVHGGAVHLSRESICAENHENFGLPVSLALSGWSQPLPGCRVSGLSQEHGVISVTPEVFQSFEIGDLIGILPIHSCLSVACMKQYFTLQGELITCL